MMGGINSQIAQNAPRFAWLMAAFERFRDFAPSVHGGVIAMGAGIGLYFALPREPALLLLGLALGLSMALYGILSRGQGYWAGWALLLLWAAFGLGRAAWHSHAVSAPQLPSYERSYNFTGWVEAIERSGKGERVRLRVISAGRLAPSSQPYRVRVRLTSKNTDLRAGDTITVRAAAKAPPGPAIPGGYDPARAAYFQRIGGFGFTYGPPEILPDAELRGMDRLARYVVRWRYGLADRIMAEAPASTAGLQAALMTGVRRFIPQEQTDNLRVSGLAHILAISGLHMGLLAGGVFSALTFALACIPRIARRWDVRKPAAVVGIVAATIYLVLSGASVATQRAYIMAVIVFLAVILDRRAMSLRSVSLAALITLGLHPESLISVGFQMSFAAVAALIVTYQAWQRYRPAYKAFSPSRRMVNFMTSLSVTSFVAGLATGGFALFHFNRIAKYGLVGNLIAMPLFSLFVMPLAVISLVLMPLGLEGVPLQLMGWTLEYILRAAAWVASFDGALFRAPSAPSYVLPIYSAGFVAICFGRKWVRLIGLAVMCVSFGFWTQSVTPDLRVSEKGRVAFWQDDTLMTDQSRGDRYGREQFEQQAGLNGTDWVRYDKSFAQCDRLACRMKIKGVQVSVLQHPSEVPLECANSDVVILSERFAGPVSRRGCQALLIDGKSLAKSGAVSLYFGAEEGDVATSDDTNASRPSPNITLRYSRDPNRQRPWSSQ